MAFVLCYNLTGVRQCTFVLAGQDKHSSSEAGMLEWVSTLTCTCCRYLCSLTLHQAPLRVIAHADVWSGQNVALSKGVATLMLLTGELSSLHMRIHITPSSAPESSTCQTLPCTQ